MWHRKQSMRLGIMDLNLKPNFVIYLLRDLEETRKISVAQFPYLKNGERGIYLHGSLEDCDNCY